MKKSRIIALVLTAALTCGAVGAAAAVSGGTEAPAAKAAPAPASVNKQEPAFKDETVYVIANPDGSVKKIIVSDQMQNTSREAAQDAASALDGAQNVKGDDCWTGTLDKELPVDMRISYTLDGRAVSAEELAGKSGRVCIRFDYENRQYEMADIDGRQEKIYVPFVVLTGAVLDSDIFSNVEVTNGRLVNDGDHIAVLGLAFPGLAQNLDLGDEELEIPDFVEISADVQGFELETTLSIVTNSVFSRLDSEEWEDLELDGLSDGLAELTDAMDQLMDGSSELYDGLCTLLSKSGELSAGMDQLAGGLSELASHNSELNGGARQVFDSLLATANTQLAAAGLEVPELTVENYSQVLGGVLSKLDSAGTYAEGVAREQVEKAVRAQESAVRDAVTQAVEQEVSAQVAEAVRQNVWDKVLAATGLTQEIYDAGVKTGLISKDQQAQLQAALDQQMQGEAAKTAVADNTRAKMASDEVAAVIEEKTEEQVQLLIAQNMASPEVQEKISAATAQASSGAVSIRALKQQLDSYNAFYAGLTSYTAGVASAKGGAAVLQSNMPALIEGVTQLRDGAEKLSDVLKEFNREGIQKLVDAFDGDLGVLADRLRATAEASKNYRSFSGLDGEMDGSVKFICRTESVKPRE